MESDDDQKVYTFFFLLQLFLMYKQHGFGFRKLLYVMEWQLQIENFDGRVYFGVYMEKRLVNYNRNSAHVPFECLLF